MNLFFKVLPVLTIMLFSINSIAKDNGLPDWYDFNRDAVMDLNHAAKIADGKKILVIAGGEWCSWCHILNKFIHSNTEVSKLLYETFVVLKVNYSEENMNQEFFEKYPKIKGYPAFIILDSNKQYLASQDTSKLELGKSYSKDAMLSFLKKWN
jgi:thioredoxin-related protein